MHFQRTLTVLLVVGNLTLLAAFVPKLQDYPTPGSNEGYEPEQPIAFSHRLHAGELQVDCQYCHFGAERSQHAGIPPAQVCMNCHKLVSAPLSKIRSELEQARIEKRSPKTLMSSEIKKIYDHLALDSKGQKDPKKTAQPIAWKKVYDLPDFVLFDHRFHVKKGVECQSCHGAIETMDRVRQVGNLSMGWCINCHRENKGKFHQGQRMQPSNDCISCHY